MLEESKLYQPETDAKGGIPTGQFVWKQETYWEERDIALKGAAKRGPWAECYCVI